MAQFTIDQAGLSAGTLDKSRTDGLSTGALVTLDASAGGGDTFLFELLWVPVGDTTAVSTLAETGNPAIWTFAPSAAFFGTYRIRLTIDAGSATESVIIRHFVVRTASKGLIIPPLNGIADSDASLLLNGAAQIASSEDNSVDYTSNTILNNFAYAGWWRALYEVIQVVEAGGGGGATAFTGLTDTPASYSGQALLFARVNAGETALEFAAAGGTPAGSSTQLQFNTAGAFDASANLAFTGSALNVGDAGGTPIISLDITSTPTIVMRSQGASDGSQVIFQESTGGASRFFMSYLELTNAVEFQASSATSMLWRFDATIPMLMQAGLLDLGASDVSATVVGADGQRKQLNALILSNGTVAASGGTLDMAFPTVTLNKTEIYSVEAHTITGTNYDYYHATVIVQRDATSTLVNRILIHDGFINPAFTMTYTITSNAITATMTNTSGTDTDDTTITGSVEQRDIAA